MVEFKDIKGFPGYRVGDDGSVWSLWMRRSLGAGAGGFRTIGVEWTKLNPSRNASGYLMVDLRAPSPGRNTLLVSRIVCQAFHGEPPTPKHEAAHENGVRDDNRAGNLMWKTRAENQADRLRHGTTSRGERCGMSKLTEDAVRAIRADARGNKAAMARRFGVSEAEIRRIVSRKRWGWMT